MVYNSLPSNQGLGTGTRSDSQAACHPCPGFVSLFRLFCKSVPLALVASSLLAHAGLGCRRRWLRKDQAASQAWG